MIISISISHAVLTTETARTLAMKCAERILRFRERIVSIDPTNQKWIEGASILYEDVILLTELLRKASMLATTLQLSLADINTLLTTCKE